MQSEDLNMDDLTKERRKALEESIHTLSVEEFKALCEGLFPYVDNPWRDKVLEFIAENSGATFHHATTHDRIHIVYCDARGKGIWFIPGGGMGPLQATGLTIMKELVAGAQ